MGDLRELVVHCGSEHGFSLYYSLVDDNIETMIETLMMFKVKKETEDPVDVKPDVNLLNQVFIKQEY